MAFAIAGDSGGLSSSCGRSLVLADAGLILQIKRKSLERLKQAKRRNSKTSVFDQT